MPWFVNSSGSKKDDRLICATCGNQLTVLFTSAVCDKCNPPDGVVPLEWWEEFSVKPVKHHAWRQGASTASTHVLEARFVALINSKDVAADRFGYVHFFKFTVNTMGNFVLDKPQKVSSACLKALHAWSWDRGNTALEAYFFKLPSQFDRITFMVWQ
jgi:hypothetical protein